MATADKREKAALAALAKESGVSENTVARVIDAMQNVDAIGLTLLLKIDKNAETESVGDAAFADAAPSVGKTGAKVTALGKAAADPDQQDDKPNGA